MKLTRSRLILLSILFLGLSLRIYDLGTESLWVDEGISVRRAKLTFSWIIKVSNKNVHPPLYFIILRYWIKLFGDSEFSSRFLSVIFGFFAIFIMYKVGSLIFDEEVGILSSLILGISVFHIRYSQEVRMYSLITLLTLLSFYFFIKLLERRSLKVSIGYILSSVLLMYTNVFGLFIIIAQNIYFFVPFFLSKESYKFDLKRWSLLQVTLIVLFTPRIMILLNQILKSYRSLMSSWIPEPSIISVLYTFREYSGSPLLLIIFLILSSFSIIKIRGNINLKDFFKSIGNYPRNISLTNDIRIYLLLVWLLTPIILPFVISKFSTPIYWTRYTIGASLAFYLLVAKGIRDVDHKFVKLVVIGIVVASSLVNVWGYYSEVNKEQWRDVAGYIDATAEHGDLLLFYFGFSHIPFDYYSKRTDLVEKRFPRKTKVEEKIKSTVEGYTRVWVILAYIEDDKGLIKTLSESHNLSFHKRYLSTTYISHQKYVGIEVYLFEKK